MDIHERISFVMNQENLTAKEFAEILDVQRSSISHLVSGRNKPSIDFLYKFIESFPKYNVVWLITGVGEILNTSFHEKSDKSTGSYSSGATKIIQHTLFEEDDKIETIDNIIKERNIDTKTENKEIVIEEKDIKQEEKDVVTNVNLATKCKYIERVVIFYSDGTFDSYTENKKYD